MIGLLLLDEQDSEGRNLYRLTADYRFDLAPEVFVTVPAGYQTNFGTVPRWLWWWVSPGELHAASIVHDYLVEEFGGDSGFSRWMADAVLMEGMSRQGLGYFRRLTVWMAVRAWSRWGAKR